MSRQAILINSFSIKVDITFHEDLVEYCLFVPYISSIDQHTLAIATLAFHITIKSLTMN